MAEIWWKEERKGEVKSHNNVDSQVLLPVVWDRN